MTSQPQVVAINVSSGSGGKVEGGGRVRAGETVTVRAIPDEGFELEAWDIPGGLVVRQPELTFVANQDQSLKASFRRAFITIEADAFPQKGGRVIGAGRYSFGQKASLFALAEPGYLFAGWEGLPPEQQDALVQFPAEKPMQVRARFRNIETKFTLKLQVRPAGGGSVAGGGSFAVGSQVEISATPADGYGFSHWQGGRVTAVKAAKSQAAVFSNEVVTAVFILKRIAVTVQTSPQSAGEVTGAGLYKEGERATLKATAKPGWRFLRWDGPVGEPTQSTTLVTCLTDTALTALFIQDTR